VFWTEAQPAIEMHRSPARIGEGRRVEHCIAMECSPSLNPVSDD